MNLEKSQRSQSEEQITKNYFFAKLSLPMKELPAEHSLYNVSSWEIFWKNFLVGFSRAVGGFLVQLAFLIFAYYSFVNVVLPKIQPFVNAFISAQENMSRLQDSGSMFDGMFINESETVEPTPRQTR